MATWPPAPKLLSRVPSAVRRTRAVSSPVPEPAAGGAPRGRGAGAVAAPPPARPPVGLPGEHDPALPVHARREGVVPAVADGDDSPAALPEGGVQGAVRVVAGCGEVHLA